MHTLLFLGCFLVKSVSDLDSQVALHPFRSLPCGLGPHWGEDIFWLREKKVGQRWQDYLYIQLWVTCYSSFSYSYIGNIFKKLLILDVTQHSRNSVCQYIICMKGVSERFLLLVLWRQNPVYISHLQHISVWTSYNPSVQQPHVGGGYVLNSPVQDFLMYI